MTQVRRFGVDEAGRGPVFGPMVVAAVACNVATLPKGVRDSKQVSPSRRRALANTLRDQEDISIATTCVSPAEIDAEEMNMTDLTVTAFVEVIDALEPTDCGGMVDACDTDTDRFERRIDSQLETPVTLEAKHGADDSDPVVGAASIIAKVERDERIAALAEEYGDIGSGYPSDPTTREFLTDYVEQHGEVPPFARTSWSTCQDALDSVSSTE